MADWSPSGNFLLGQNIDETSTTQKQDLGTIVTCKHSTYGVGTFIYLKGVASTAVGTWVTYKADDNSTTLLTANAIDPVAVSMAANVADTYGWYQVKGKAIGLALPAFPDNANVYTTATPGYVDDTTIPGDRVKRAKSASAVDADGFAEFEIDYPFMDDATAA